MLRWTTIRLASMVVALITVSASSPIQAQESDCGRCGEEYDEEEKTYTHSFSEGGVYYECAQGGSSLLSACHTTWQEGRCYESHDICIQGVQVLNALYDAVEAQSPQLLAQSLRIQPEYVSYDAANGVLLVRGCSGALIARVAVPHDMRTALL